MKRTLDTKLVKAVMGTIPIPEIVQGKEENLLKLGIIELDPEDIKQRLYKNERGVDQIIKWHNQSLFAKKAYLEKLVNSLPERTQIRLENEIARAKASIKIQPTISYMRKKYMAPPEQYEEKPSKTDFERSITEIISVVTEKMIPAELYGQKLTAILPYPDRSRHTHVVAGTGSGKSELIKVLVQKDIDDNNGCLIIDPHGDVCKDILQFNIPQQKVVYLSADFAEHGWTFKYNIFDHGFHDKPALIKQPFIAMRASELLGSFEKIFESELPII